MRSGGWATSVIGVLVGALVVVAPPAASEPGDDPAPDLWTSHEIVADPASTSWGTVVSEHAAWPHGGAATLATGTAWRFWAGGALDDHVRIELVRGAYEIHFRFAPPFGETLAPGEYRGTSNDADVGRAGLSITSGGNACNEGAGSFTVHDVDAALTRLWITYDYRCEGSGGPAITGELRLNQPRPPAFSVAPTRTTWPEEPVGEPGRLVPVTLMNTGTTALTVSSADVTKGRSDFGVVHDTCGLVPAGGFCRAHVQFQPTATGRRTGALTFRTARGDRVVPLSAVGTPGTGGPIPARPVRVHAEPPGAEVPRVTRWRQQADPDAWVGNPGSSQQYNAIDVERQYGTDTKFFLEATDGDPSAGFEIYLEADHDHLLLPGTTVTPVRITSPDGPYDTGKLEIRGQGRGCGGDADRTFTVFETTYDLDGTLTGIALSYRFRCLTGDGYDGETRGSIAFNATCIPGMPGGPNEDRCIPAAEVDRPTRIDMARHVLPGDRHRFTGRLVPGDRRVVLLQRFAPGGSRWNDVRHLVTSPDGRFSATLTHPARGYYRAYYAGSPESRPAQSRTIRVRMPAP